MVMQESWTCPVAGGSPLRGDGLPGRFGVSPGHPLFGEDNELSGTESGEVGYRGGRGGLAPIRSKSKMSPPWSFGIREAYPLDKGAVESRIKSANFQKIWYNYSRARRLLPPQDCIPPNHGFLLRQHRRQGGFHSADPAVPGPVAHVDVHAG